jgi:hypothetical protein
VQGAAQIRKSGKVAKKVNAGLVNAQIARLNDFRPLISRFGEPATPLKSHCGKHLKML